MGSEPRRGVPQSKPESAPAPLSEDQEVRGRGEPGPGVPGQVRRDAGQTGKGTAGAQVREAATWPEEVRRAHGRGSPPPGPGSARLAASPQSREPVGPGVERAVISVLAGLGPERTEVNQLCPPLPQLGRREAGGGRLRRASSRRARAPRGPALAPARSAPCAFVTNNSPSVGALAG